MEPSERTWRCPPWCVTDPAEHAQDAPEVLLHQGPSFGLLRTWLLDGDPPSFTATIADTVAGANELTTDELRQLATDALDAALWMERQHLLGFGERGRPSVVDLVRQAHERGHRSA